MAIDQEGQRRDGDGGHGVEEAVWAGGRIAWTEQPSPAIELLAQANRSAVWRRLQNLMQASSGRTLPHSKKIADRKEKPAKR